MSMSNFGPLEPSKQCTVLHFVTQIEDYSQDLDDWKVEGHYQSASERFLVTVHINLVLALLQRFLLHTGNFHTIIGPCCTRQDIVTCCDPEAIENGYYGVISALRIGFAGKANVVIPFVDGCHFRVLCIHAKDKSVFIFDSLYDTPPCDLFNAVGNFACNQGFDLKFMHRNLQLLDVGGPWSCGVWACFMAFVFVQFCCLKESVETFQGMLGACFETYLVVKIIATGLCDAGLSRNYADILSRNLKCAVLTGAIGSTEINVLALPGQHLAAISIQTLHECAHNLLKCIQFLPNPIRPDKKRRKLAQRDTDVSAAEGLLREAGLSSLKDKQLGTVLLQCGLHVSQASAAAILAQCNVRPAPRPSQIVPEVIRQELQRCSSVNSSRHASVLVAVRIYLAQAWQNRILLPAIWQTSISLRKTLIQEPKAPIVCADEQFDLFNQAKAAVQLDFAKGTLGEWSERILQWCDNGLPREFVDRQVFALHRSMLSSNGVPLDNEDDAESVSSDADERLPPRVSLEVARRRFGVSKVEGPTEPCLCCTQLEFPSAMTRCNERLLDAAAPQVAEVLNAADPLGRLLCRKCAGEIAVGEVPDLLYGGECPFSVIPDSVKKLSDIEADLVAPRIAFAKIKQVLPQMQNQLVGAVINVPSSIDSTQQLLPRCASDMEVVGVNLKRKLEYKHAVSSGNVRPAALLDALQDLAGTPLYVAEDVRLKSLQETVTGLSQVEDTVSHAQEDDSATADIVGDEDESGLLRGETYLDAESSSVLLQNQVMNLAPASGSTPMHILRDEYAEELSFPKLFAGHARRGALVNLSHLKRSRFELRSSDRRFASSPANIFWKLRKQHVITVCRSATVSVKKAQVNKVTAEQLLNPFDKDRICKHDLGYTNMKALKSSPDYKKQIKVDLLAKIRQLGTPTWFATFSAADTKWNELLRMLHRVAHKTVLSDEQLAAMSFKQKADLVANDPVTCARYFDRRFRSFMTAVLLPIDLIGEVTDYAGVDEFQHRGTPHVHILLWVKDAPVYDGTNGRDIARFVDDYVTTDSSAVSEEFASLQRHNHTRRCNGLKSKCAFGFPRFPMDMTSVLEPLAKDHAQYKHSRDCLSKVKNLLKQIDQSAHDCKKAGRICPDETLSFRQFLDRLALSREEYVLAVQSGLNKVSILHKRKVLDRHINPFNAAMLETWGANIDLQFVTNPFAAAVYIASYMMKGQKGMSDLMASVVAGNEYNNSADLIKRMGSAFINTHEVCVQEAVYHLLGLPLRRFSRAVRYVPTAVSANRYRVAKTSAELKELPPESTKCFKSGAPEHYVTREGALELCCYAEYMAKYSWNPVSKLMDERKQRRVIRWHNTREDVDPEEHCRQQVMLFTSWRNEEEMKAEDETWQACHARKFGEIRGNKPNFQHMSDDAWQEVLEEVEHVQNEQAAFDADVTEGECFGDNLQLAKRQPTGNAQQGTIIQQKANMLSPLDYRNLVASLNPKQRRFFMHCLSSIEQESEAMRIFLTGGAGVGKTVVVRALTQLMLQKFSRKASADVDTIIVLLAAPTGKAAYNIRGYTLHAALDLPLNQKGYLYSSMSVMRLRAAQSRFASLKAVIIDEISMVGAKMFSFINLRFQEIMDNPLPFGGLHVILVGDLFQLCPIGDSWIFAPAATEQNLWRMFRAFELTDIMRQKGDARFAQLLNRMREGSVTQEDRALLATRHCFSVPNEVPCLFAYNEPKDVHNHAVMLGHAGPAVVLEANHDVLPGTKAEQVQVALEAAKQITSKTACNGLSVETQLKPGLPVELHLNVDVQDGLVNGASGIFRGLYTDTRPHLTWVEFDDPDIGKDARSRIRGKYCGVSQAWTPIYRVTKEITAKCTKVNRHQFPLAAASGRTVHHVQGSTFPSIGIDLCKTSRTQKRRLTYAMHYTSLSRCTSLDGCFIRAFHEDEIAADPKVIAEMQYIRAHQMLTLKYPVFAEASSTMTLSSHNLQSFATNKECFVASDHFLQGDVCLLQETHCSLANSLPLQIDVFELVGFPNSVAKTPHGIAITARTGTCSLIHQHSYCVNTRLEILAVAYQGLCNLINVYSPPKGSIGECMAALEDVLLKCPLRETVIAGDFNIDLQSRTGESFKQAMENMGFHNCPTGATTSNNTTIDSVWTNATGRYSARSAPTYYSDHHVLYVHRGS